MDSTYQLPTLSHPSLPSLIQYALINPTPFSKRKWQIVDVKIIPLIASVNQPQ